MTLPASGPISLDDIHQEVGGMSGTQCSLNDADIRFLNSEAADGAEQSFDDFYGLTNAEIITVTEGSSGSSYGFVSSSYGSVSPTTFLSKSITQITVTDGSPDDSFIVRLDGEADGDIQKVEIEGYDRALYAQPFPQGDQLNTELDVSLRFYRLFYLPTGWDGAGTRDVTLFNLDGAPDLTGTSEAHAITVAHEVEASDRSYYGWSRGQGSVTGSGLGYIPLNTGALGTLDSGSGFGGRYRRRCCGFGYFTYGSAFGDTPPYSWFFGISFEAFDSALPSNFFTSITLDDPAITLTAASATTGPTYVQESGDLYERTIWTWTVAAPTSAWDAGETRTVTINY